MGKDKASLEIAGLAMIQHVFRALRPVVDRILVVTRTPIPGNNESDVEVIPDALDDRGSLIGLYSGLLRSRDEYNLVVACDMPFLNTGLLSYMADQIGRHEVVLPKVGEFIEPLHAIYHRDLLPVIERHIRSGGRRIRSIFTDRRIRYITETEIDRFDPGRRSFINLNTREEYKEATCSDLECRS